MDSAYLFSPWLDAGLQLPFGYLFIYPKPRGNPKVQGQTFKQHSALSKRPEHIYRLSVQ